MSPSQTDIAASIGAPGVPRLRAGHTRTTQNPTFRARPHTPAAGAPSNARDGADSAPTIPVGLRSRFECTIDVWGNSRNRARYLDPTCSAGRGRDSNLWLPCANGCVPDAADRLVTFSACVLTRSGRGHA